MPARRQNQSCDSCRQRRKRCDAGVLGIDPSSNYGSHQKRQSCSACARSARTCTFDWLKKQRLEITFLPPRSTNARPRKSSRTSGGQFYAENLEGDNDSSYARSPSARPNPIRTPLQPPSSTIPMTWSASPPPWLTSALDEFAVAEQHLNASSTSSPSSSYPPWSGMATDCSAWPSQASAIEPSIPDTDHVLTDSSSHSDNYHGAFFGVSAFDSDASASRLQTSSSPSALSLADDRLAAALSRQRITDVLITIYRSNLEDVLLSWSNPATCPYVTSQKTHRHTSPETGCSTFYERAKQLDRSLTRLRLANDNKISALNDQEASQVLNKAVLAFASQWNHEASRSRHETSLSLGDDDEDLAQELHMTMHKTLWQDAYMALQRAEHLTHSFRVIFAKIIFSFLRRPIDTTPNLSKQCTDDGRSPSAWDEEQPLCGLDSNFDCQSRPKPQDLCQQLLTEYECSLQLRNASHELIRWRRQFSTRLRLEESCKQDALSQQKSFLTEFNTLFWLGVMCDTTSSAVTGNPLVITDEDCAIDVRSPDPQINNDRHRTASATALSHYFQKDPQPTFTTKRTPLWNSLLSDRDVVALDSSHSSLDAEWTLKQAIPLKVLLFRRIATIQTLLSQFASPHRIENAIQDALLVHQQWTIRYESFMISCVDEYARISRKTRSWHAILAAHWYYGLMLLSSKIRSIDEDELGDPRRAEERCRNSTAATLALSSATSMARLATYCISVPDYSATFEESSHIMLSEPWCEIMVRSLTTAVETIFRLGFSEHGNSNIGGNDPSLLHGVEACLKALVEIGRTRYKPAGMIATRLTEMLLLQRG